MIGGTAVLRRAGVLLAGVVAGVLPSASQTGSGVGARVSYVSGVTAYVTVGRERGVAPGDSAWVVRGKSPGGVLVITAISATSASARGSGDSLGVEVGDSVLIRTASGQPEAAGAPIHDSQRAGSPAAGDVLTGNVALQFAGATSSDGGWTFIQPALLLRLNARSLPGGFSFSLHGRSSYDLGPDIGRFPLGRRHSFRVYTMSLVADNPSEWYGVGFGRLVSPYVSGLGAFDGGQVVVRRGGFTAGILGGLQPDYVTSGVDGDRQKFAGFLSYRSAPAPFASVQASLAYGQQLLRGRLDRDFLYVQSSFAFGSRFFLAQSSELDLHRSEGGDRKAALRLTNTYVSLSSEILDWFGVSLGYDATRPIFLLETMKAIPDTLFDSDLYQGFRAGVSFRIPGGVFLMGQASVRSKPDGSQTARSGGGSVRVMDVLGSGVNLGARYSRNNGVYTEGNDFGVDVDRYFPWGFSFALRAGQYRYALRGIEGESAATTAGLGLTWVAPSGWYLTGSLDQTWDPLRRSSRFLAEAGKHF